MQIGNDSHTVLIFVCVDEPTVTGMNDFIIENISETHRGLSGKSSDPPARIAPIMHCMKSGARHAMSDSIYEQK